MNIKLLATITPLMVLSLVGCDKYIVLDVSTTSIENTVAGSKPSVANASLSIEMNSKDDCNNQKEKLSTTLSSFFNIKKSKCKDKSYSADIEVPIVLTDSKGVNNNYKGGMSLQLVAAKDSVNILVAIKKDQLATLRERVKSSFDESINSTDVKLKFFIKNDGKHSYNFAASAVYLNGTPIPPFKTASEKFVNNNSNSIVLSDVAQDSLIDRDMPYALIAGLQYALDK